MDAPQFRHISCTTFEDVLVVTIVEPQVRGDDLAAELQEQLLAALTHYKPSKVVLNLQNVVAINSRGFGAIAVFHQELYRNLHGQAALCGLSPDVRTMLGVIRFIDNRGSSPVVEPETPPTDKPRGKPLFEIVAANIESAIARLKAPAGA